MKIYVGNLPYDLKESELEEEFGAFGQVDSAKIIKDMATNKSKGFGFVEMSDNESAKAAIAALDGKEFKGRALKVNEARPRPEGGPRGGEMRRGGGGGGGGKRRGGGGGRF